MNELEKVIAGLESCRPGRDCDGCPYHELFMKGRCNKQMEEDALVLLKAQVPRVMTLDEAREAIRDGGEDVIFWEEKMSYKPQRLLIGLRIPEEFTFEDGEYVDYDVLDDPEVARDYGLLFRLWTSRPSAEMMANTPWEGEAE